MHNVFKNKNFMYFLIIIFLGIFVRIWAFFHNYGINPDAVLYLFQTWALAKGNLAFLKTCNISERITHINLFSLSIIPFYYIFKNLEIAGKIVSLISSSFSLVFLYFILKRFFKGGVLYLTLLVYAIHPILVKESSEILRESFFSFLFLIGLWSFIKGWESHGKSKSFYLILSSIVWILSAWVRIEGLLFVLFSGGYLFIKAITAIDKKEELKNLLWFLVFPSFLFIAGIIYLSCFKGFIITEWLGKVKIINPFEQPFAKLLKKFKYMHIPSPTPYFWYMVKQNLWLIALGTTLFYKFIPALYAPNLLFLLAGFKNLKNNLKIYPYLTYFLGFIIFYFIILWYFCFTHWYMEKRYMLPLLYLLSPFIGLGIENIKNWLIKNCRINYKKATGIILLYILIFSLPKSIASIRKEKAGIKKLGMALSKYFSTDIQKSCSGRICSNLIFTSDARILFYACNNKNFLICPRVLNRKLYYKLSQNPQKMVEYIIKRGYRFVVLEEKYLKKNIDKVKKLLEKKGYKCLEEQRIKLGRLILLIKAGVEPARS